MIWRLHPHMQSKFLNDKKVLVLRLDIDEEVVASILKAAEYYKIPSGIVSGIGAVNFAEIGLYDTSKKKYIKTTLREPLEIAALNGSLSKKDGSPYAHLHVVFGDSNGRTYGGHLDRAIVSATAEIFVQINPEPIERSYSADIGLNLMALLETL